MPPKYVMDQAPLLQGLEHNAIYHVLSWRRPRIGYSMRQAGDWAYNLAILVLVAAMGLHSNLGVGIMIWAQWGIVGMSFALLAYIWFIVRRRRRDVSLREFFGIDELRLHDLKAVPISAENIAVGVWGYRCQINFRRFILPAFAPLIFVWSVDPWFQRFASAIIIGVAASLPFWIWFLSRQQAALGVYLAMIETGEYLNLSKENGEIMSGTGISRRHGLIWLVILLQILIFIILAVRNRTMVIPNPVFALCACFSASLIGWTIADHMHFAREACWSRLMLNCESIQRLLNKAEIE